MVFSLYNSIERTCETKQEILFADAPLGATGQLKWTSCIIHNLLEVMFCSLPNSADFHVNFVLVPTKAGKASDMKILKFYCVLLKCSVCLLFHVLLFSFLS